jgi:hypothetical protein
MILNVPFNIFLVFDSLRSFVKIVLVVGQYLMHLCFSFIQAWQ